MVRIHIYQMSLSLINLILSSIFNVCLLVITFMFLLENDFTNAFLCMIITLLFTISEKLSAIYALKKRS
jgi:hypothetical protein